MTAVKSAAARRENNNNRSNNEERTGHALLASFNYSELTQTLGRLFIQIQNSEKKRQKSEVGRREMIVKDSRVSVTQRSRVCN